VTTPGGAGQASAGLSGSGTITDTICVANKPVTRAVADDLSGAFFDRGAFPGTLVTVEQRKIGELMGSASGGAQPFRRWLSRPTRGCGQD